MHFSSLLNSLTFVFTSSCMYSVVVAGRWLKTFLFFLQGFMGTWRLGEMWRLTSSCRTPETTSWCSSPGCCLESPSSPSIPSSFFWAGQASVLCLCKSQIWKRIAISTLSLESSRIISSHENIWADVPEGCLYERVMWDPDLTCSSCEDDGSSGRNITCACSPGQWSRTLCWTGGGGVTATWQQHLKAAAVVC